MLGSVGIFSLTCRSFPRAVFLLATTIDSHSKLLEFILFSNADLKLNSSHAI